MLLRSQHHAALGLGFLALLGGAFAWAAPPNPALNAPTVAATPDDDDDEEPRRGPRLPEGKALGLALTLTRGDVRDTRSARVVALAVPAGTAPSAFLPAGGPFRATWEGDLAIPLRGEYTFHAAGRGTLRVELNGKVALEGSGDDLAAIKAEPIKLRKGANKLVVTYDAPGAGDAAVRLGWSSEDFGREPMQVTDLTRDADHADLATGMQLREGRVQLASLRCLKCHDAGPAAQPGATSLPELETDAPNLADVGSRLDRAWMARWIADPKALRPTSTMPRLLHGAASAAQAADLAAFLATLKSPTAPRPLRVPEKAEANSVEMGGRLFANLGCIGCHTRPDRDDWQADPNRVPLRLAGTKYEPEALVAFLLRPDRHYAWVRMPNFHFTDAEARQVAAFVAGAPKVALAEESRAVGDPGRGKALFATVGCASCHALPGVTDRVKAPAVGSIAPDRWAGGCLDPAESPDRKAPNFALPEASAKAIAAFAKLGLESLRRDAAPEFAERQIRALNCTACHRRDGYDDAWAEHKVEVDNLLANAPLEEHGPDGVPYPAAQQIPLLTWTGEKLRADWSAAFIAGKLDYKPRPYLRARMPAFATRADGLAHGMSLEHGYPIVDPAEPPSDPNQIPDAHQIVRATGMNCVSCHNIGPKPAVGVFEAPGVNFMWVKERLRHDYYVRWVRAPLRVDPETKMPTYFNGENSVLPTVLDGKTNKQIASIWNYLLEGTKIEPPAN